MISHQEPLRLLYLPDEALLGDQVGPRRAFEAMQRDGRLAAYESFSPACESAGTGPGNAITRLVVVARMFQPTVVLWSHPSGFPVSPNLLAEFRCLESRPTVVLQDMDAWGLLRGRLNTSVRVVARDADLVYLSGTGSLSRVFRRSGARRVRYCFDGADGARFGTPWSPTDEREFDVVMVGNRNRGRLPGSALPGAWRRARLVELLEQQYGPRFALFGQGWEGHQSWKGQVAFNDQETANRSAWVSVSWDHFPNISNYTSNRVPISLAGGIPHITNYKPGYELIYPPGSGLYWGKSVRAVAETVAVVLATPTRDLIAIGERAAEFARNHRSQEAFMTRLIEDVANFRRSTRSER